MRCCNAMFPTWRGSNSLDEEDIEGDTGDDYGHCPCYPSYLYPLVPAHARRRYLGDKP